MADYIYDCETYPNCFQVNIEDAKDCTRWSYKISYRADHSHYNVQMLETMRDRGTRIVRFNNFGIDNPILT